MARASKFTVSKVSTGRRRQDARVVETARARTHFREVAIARRSKLSWLGGDETELHRSIMWGRAASMASRAASCVLSRWRHPRRYRCGFVAGRASRKCPAPSPWHAWTAGAAALRVGRRRAPLYAIDATRHKSRQQPELRRAAPRSSSLTRPLRLRVRILQPRPVIRRPERSVGGRESTLASAGDQGRLDDLVHASFSLFANRSAI